MALTLVVAIIFFITAKYKDAFYQIIQFVWLSNLYFSLNGWVKSTMLNDQIIQEWDKTAQALLESTKREEIAHKIIEELRKRIESK